MKTHFNSFSLVLAAVFVLTFSSCSRKVYGAVATINPEYEEIIGDKLFKKANTEMDTIIGMENLSSTPAKKILATGRKMALDEKLIIPGSCWNWVNEVFNRAGFGKDKKIIYKSKYHGPYADLSLIKPGDWLYYINYTYRAVEHSGIFVYWKDFEKKIGVVLSYSGRNRKVPGRYLSYDLKHVYYITRAIEK